MTELRTNIANICLLAYLLTVVCLDDITLTCTCVMDFVVLFTFKCADVDCGLL